MDLIASLAGQLGISPDQAQAVAGTVIGGVKNAVGDEFGDDTASQMDAAVPELGDWKSKAAGLLGDSKESSGGLGGLLGGGAGGLLGAAAGALGGEGLQDMAAVAGILSKLGIDSSKATMVAPLVLGFLEKRVDKDLLDKMLKVAPMLTGATKGGVGGMLGGLLG